MAVSTKRLSFGDTTLHRPEHLEIQHFLHAERQPSADSFATAVQHLDAANFARFVKIKDVAREQSLGCGESDLRRLKRHFASHKNAFTRFDVKQSFLEGLAANLPDGTEEDAISEITRELEKQAEAVKQHKEHNSALQDELKEVIDGIVGAYKAFSATKAEIGSYIECLVSEAAQREEEGHEPLPEIGDGPDENGPLQAACKALLAREALETRTLEADLAAEEADAKELAAAIQSEEEHLHILRAQVEELEYEESDPGTYSIALSLSESVDWLDAMIAMMGQLSGVEILSAAESPLRLRLTTYFPEPSSPEEVRAGTCSHNLAIEIDKACCVRTAVLDPPDVALDDIAAAAQAGPRDLFLLVLETQARLAGYFARNAAIQDAQLKHGLVAAGEELFDVALGGGVTATLSVPGAWPSDGGRLAVVAMRTASDVPLSDAAIAAASAGAGGCDNLSTLIEHLAVETEVAFGQERP